MFDTDTDPVVAADRAHIAVGGAHRAMLSALARIEAEGLWHGDGARSCAHWVQMRYGISSWKAERWVEAAGALEHLPGVAEALSSGALTIDKVVELTRLATPETEAGLTRWAERVPAGAIRERADLERRRSVEETRTTELARSVRWWHEHDRFTMLAELPVAQGAAVRKALDRIARTIPAMPDEDGPFDLAARRADALLGLCQARLSADPDPDRATVVVHARLEPDGGFSAGELDDGPPVAPATVERLACTARVQPVLEDACGEAIAFGRMRREPSAAMVRQVRYRDRGCVFPGCGTRSFTEAHHVVWWSKGGRTDLDNLVLTCSFHHRLVHEHGWALYRTPSGEVRWFRPGGQRYRAGPPRARPADRVRSSFAR